MKLFNEKTDEIANSGFLKEMKEKKLGYTLRGELNEKTGNFDFEYDVSHHNEDLIQSLVLTLRMFAQNDEHISLFNMNTLYNEIDID